MLLFHMELINGLEIKHPRNGREYRLPELPHFNVDGYCAETNTFYEYYRCHCQGNACQPFRKVITKNGDSIADREQCQD